VDKLPSQRGTKGAPEPKNKAKKARAAKSPLRDDLLDDSVTSAKEMA